MIVQVLALRQAAALNSALAAARSQGLEHPKRVEESEVEGALLEHLVKHLACGREAAGGDKVVEVEFEAVE